MAISYGSLKSLHLTGQRLLRLRDLEQQHIREVGYLPDNGMLVCVPTKTIAMEPDIIALGVNQ